MKRIQIIFSQKHNFKETTIDIKSSTVVECRSENEAHEWILEKFPKACDIELLDVSEWVKKKEKTGE